MIVTLAGHVDHGKTSLVKALTGVDTDRLEEEQRRGLTIDLGFAYTDFGGHRIGFVDVPGHRKFVHNMVAGVAAHQFGLVVVAADDGVMPQTIEHLQILQLIGVNRAVFALTKIDRSSAERIAAVHDEIRRLGETYLSDEFDVIETSVIEGTGVEALRDALVGAAQRQPSAQSDKPFRLSVDRAFLIRGSGLVVTGTVHSGGARVGDELTLAPAGKPVRVRSLHVQDSSTDVAAVGDRCAMNVTGIERDDIERGDWLVAPETFAPTTTVVVDVHVLGDFPRTVKHWLPVHVYHAAGHAAGHVALLDSAPLNAGDQALIELDLDTPLHPKHGDPIVLRDHARERTLGGGTVVDTTPATRGRRKPERLTQLQAQRTSDTEAAFDALLETVTDGVDLERFRLLRNLHPTTMDALLANRDIQRCQLNGRSVVFPADVWRRWCEHLVERIEAYHKSAPHSPGLNQEQLSKVADVPRALLPALLAHLQASAKVQQSGGHYQATSFHAQLPPAEERRLREIETLLSEGEQPPSLGDMAKRLGGNLRSIQTAVREFAKTGRLVIVSDTRAFLPEQIRDYVAVAESLQQASAEGFSVRQFRDATGIGRNLAIEVLEFFDARGFTRRFDDKRRIVGEASRLKIA